MPRHRRDEIERFEAIGYAAKRTISAADSTLLLAAGIGGASGGLIGYAVGGWSVALGGAGVGCLFLSFVTLLLMWDTIGNVFKQRRETPDDEWPFTLAGDRRHVRLPEGVTEQRMWSYLRGVADGRVTLSQDGAGEYDLDREQSNAVKQWLIRHGFWVWTNEANGTGDFTDKGDEMLQRLREGALWRDIMSEVE